MDKTDRGLKTVLVVLVLVAVLGTLLSGMLMGPVIMRPGMMWGYDGSTAWSSPTGWTWTLAMTVGMLVMLTRWALLIVGVIFLVRWAVDLSARTNGPTAPDAPEAILRRRYEAGDIDRAAYERIRRDLRGDLESETRRAVDADAARTGSERSG